MKNERFLLEIYLGFKSGFLCVANIINVVYETKGLENGENLLYVQENIMLIPVWSLQD